MEKQSMPSPINRGRGRIGRLLGPRKLHKLGAVNPCMEKQKPAKPMPNQISRGRGRIGRLLGPRNLQKLGVAFPEAKSVPTKRGRGRPWGSGKWQILTRAESEQQLEVTKSARFVQPTAEPHLPADTWFWNVTSSRSLSGARLIGCSSAPTESSAVPSTFTQPFNADNGVKGEKPGATLELRRIDSHPLPGANNGDITKSFTMLSGGLVQNYSEDMSRAQLPDLEMGTGQLQPNFEIVSGLPAVDPSMKKQKLARLMPNRTNRGRGRIGRLCGPRDLQKLRAPLEQQSEAPKSAILQLTETHLPSGTHIASEKEEMMPGGAPLKMCSSAQFILINSSTESSAVPSTCTEPFNGDKGETPGASQEHIRMNPQPLPEGGQCLNEAKNGKEWDSASVMKAIIRKHGDITKSCKFQSLMFKKNCLESICRIVKKLQETRLTDINPGLLKEFYSFIEDAESVNMDVKWLRKHVDEVEDAMSSAVDELKRLEQAERDLRQENEERKRAIEVKKVKVAKIQSEIWVQEEKLASGILTSNDLKARISCIKSRCHCSDYVAF